jgi:hypothetical protein
MKIFILKIVNYYCLITILSIALYSFTKHNLIFDITAKKFVQAFSQKNLVIKHEIAEERRVVTQNIIKNKGKHFQNLIIGSSRVMQFGRQTGFKNSLNLGVSGANLYDIKYIYILTQENSISYDTIIFDFNPWLVTNSDSRYKQFERLHIAKYALYDILKFNYNSEDLISLIGLVTNYQFSYTTASAEDIDSHSYFIKFTDGSIQLKKKEEDQRKKEIDKFVKNLYQMHGFYSIDTNKLNKTIRIFNTASSFGKCIVTLTPFHHNIYIEKKSDKRIQNISLIERKISESKRNFEVLGSFDPNKIDVTETDFLDGFHLNEFAINKIFAYSTSSKSNRNHQGSN